MKKILVTGATGFIGQYIILELLKNNVEIIASSANPEKAKTCAWYSKVKYIPFNFKDFNPRKNYFSFFQQPDILIHLAWEGLPQYTQAFHTEINLPRHSALLTNLIEHGLKNITVTGTCFEYGKTEGKLDESMPAHPINAYALAKNTLRITLEVLLDNIYFHLKWVRLFYMYGRGQNPNSLLSQLDVALENGETAFNMSGGEQERDYLPVETVAAYLVKIALQDKVEGIINCCSGNPVRVKDIVEKYLKEKQCQIKLNLGYYPYNPNEAMRFWGDKNKLETILQGKK
jgi:dTDP-6-deoxy-L-talose 4-dehydrogenase (NAD+)